MFLKVLFYLGSELIEADDILQLPVPLQVQQGLDGQSCHEASLNLGVLQAVGQILDSQGIIQGNDGHPVQNASDVGYHPLVPVLGEDSH